MSSSKDSYTKSKPHPSHRTYFIQREFEFLNKICIKCGEVDHRDGWCPDCMRCWNCMDKSCRKVKLK